MPDRGAPQLLGPWMTMALVVGGIIGSGIFLLPVALAPLGPNAIIGWLVSGIGALCIAFALARLAWLSAAPMPTAWLPCPGKRKARITDPVTISNCRAA